MAVVSTSGRQISTAPCARGGVGGSPSWRLRRVHEAEEAETNEWYHYPNGRVYYTQLRQHMKEVVNEQIAEARREGFKSTRCKSGPKCAATRSPRTHAPEPAA